MKSHKWLAGKLDSSKCAICKRAAVDHTIAAICENCGKRGDCEIIDHSLLCDTCQVSEREAIKELIANPITEEPKLPDHMTGASQSDLITSQINEIDDFESDLPANGTEFYNAKVKGINELQKKIMADESIPAAERHYHFAKILTARRLTLYKHLIEAKEIIVEIESENSAIHKAINLLAANLKEEERNKLQIKYAEYTPKTPPKKILTRRSAEENVIESIAKTMFAPRNEANIIQWEALEAHERLSLVTKARDYYKNMFNKKDAK